LPTGTKTDIWPSIPALGLRIFSKIKKPLLPFILVSFGILSEVIPSKEISWLLRRLPSWISLNSSAVKSSRLTIFPTESSSKVSGSPWITSIGLSTSSSTITSSSSNSSSGVMTSSTSTSVIVGSSSDGSVGGSLVGGGFSSSSSSSSVSSIGGTISSSSDFSGPTKSSGYWFFSSILSSLKSSIPFLRLSAWNLLTSPIESSITGVIGIPVTNKYLDALEAAVYIAVLKSWISE